MGETPMSPCSSSSRNSSSSSSLGMGCYLRVLILPAVIDLPAMLHKFLSNWGQSCRDVSVRSWSQLLSAWYDGEKGRQGETNNW